MSVSTSASTSQKLVDEELVGAGQPQLGGEHAALFRLVRRGVGDQGLLERRDAADQGVECLGQLDQVPVGDLRLLAEAVRRPCASVVFGVQSGSKLSIQP